MKHKLIPICSALFLMIVPFTVSAQMKEGGGEREEMMQRGMTSEDGMGMDGMRGIHERGPGHDMVGMMRAISQLDLTPDQRKNIKQISLKHEKESIPLIGKIQMSGVELQEILMGDPIDLGKAKEKIKEKHDAMVELEVAHLLLVQEIKAQLKPEQWQKLETMMEKRPQMEMMGAHKDKNLPGKGSEKPAAAKKP